MKNKLLKIKNEAVERINNTETILDKEYTLDEFNDTGSNEVVEKFLEAKEKIKDSEVIETNIEYYPYTQGTKCLEITFYVKEEE